MLASITDLIATLGYPGVALLMFAENAFPPIPSELVMPFAGFEAARGTLTLWGVTLAGTAGALAGAWGWYEVGRRVGAERLRRWSARHGRWMALTPAEIDRAVAWFERRGALAVFVGRLVPGVRTLISVPAGVSGMPLAPFLAWSALGTGLWTFLLAAAGHWLGSAYGDVAVWLDPLSTAIVAGGVLLYGWRVVTWRPDGSERV